MTTTQPLEALVVANTRRLAAANIRARVRSGELTLAEAVMHSDAGSMRMAALLTATPGLGPVRARKILGDHFIGEYRRVDTLTERQRVALGADPRLSGSG